MRFKVTDGRKERYVDVKWRPVAIDKIAAGIASAKKKITIKWWLVVGALVLGLLLGHGSSGCHLPPIPWPTPGPTPPPVPPQPKGLQRVLIVYESAAGDYDAKIRADGALRKYLDEKCLKDGKQPEYRFLDKDADPSNESKVWQDAMKLEHPSVPWLFVQSGEKWYGMVLPKTAEETLAAIKKFGG